MMRPTKVSDSYAAASVHCIQQIFSTFLLLFLCFPRLLFSQEALPNHSPANVNISNIRIGAANKTDQYRRITFDIGWDYSWRTSQPPNNWDAAWIFLKYQVPGAEWSHATLSVHSKEHIYPQEAMIAIPQDGKGVFIYRSKDGTGTFQASNVSLRWDYGRDSVADDAAVEVRVLGVIMVYIPEGSFFAGDNGYSMASFTRGSNDNRSWFITSENTMEVTNTASNGYYYRSSKDYWNERWNASEDVTGTAFTIPTDFPKGYRSFYCMKYELSQQQYVDFLNTLTGTQAANRYNRVNYNKFGYTISESNGVYSTTHPERACGFLPPADGFAYADWAGLRPMTELEFEKICRGSGATPVSGEFAWGTTAAKNARGAIGTESDREYITTSGANCYYLEENFSPQFPLNIGIFASSGKSREMSGASYYGVMEMSGNLDEICISVGNAIGRAFTHQNGDGRLASDGFNDESSWPLRDGRGAGYRGGNFGREKYFMQVSNREDATVEIDYTHRHIPWGFRGVRTMYQESVDTYFAQLADGGGYTTQFMLANPDESEISGTLDLFRSDGNPLVLELNGQRAGSFPVIIKPRGTLILKSGGSGTEVLTGWARLRTTAALGCSLLYSFSRGGRRQEEAGLDPSLPIRNFRISVDNRRGFMTGLAMANPNSTAINLNLALYDTRGNRQAIESHRLGGRQHSSKLVSEWFPGQNLNEFTGTVAVQSAEGTVLGTTLRFDSGLNGLSSIPVIDIEAGSEPTILYFPQIADGGGYYTNLTLINPGTTAISARPEFFAPDGTPLRLTLQGNHASGDSVSLPTNGSVFLETAGSAAPVQVGWARVKADGPIGGAVLFGYRRNGEIQSEAGINPAVAVSDFVIPVDRHQGLQSGLAVANPSESGNATLTLSLYDTAGTPKGMPVIRELDAGKQFALLIEELFPGIDLAEFAGLLMVKSSGTKVIGTTLRFDTEVSLLASIPVTGGLSIDPSTPSLPVLTTAGASGITSSSVISGGMITSDGGAAIIARGVCWSTNKTPTISDNKTMNGIGPSSYTSWVTKLAANTTYHLRGYATNSAGTGYSDTVTITTSPYNPLEYFGQSPPGRALQYFAPGIAPNWIHSNITFSPDGKEAYWASTTTIYFKKVEDEKWVSPQVIYFSGHGTEYWYDDVPVVSPDNNKLFFLSKRQIGYASPNKENIWFVERSSNGWSEPKQMPQQVNSLQDIHWQISIAGNGNIYYSGGGSKIYVSRFMNGEYTGPEQLSETINTGDLTCPFIAPDESYLIFCKITAGIGSLHISFKDNYGQWCPPVKIEQFTNCVNSFVSRDGKYLFVHNQWISAEILEDFRPRN